MTIVSWAQTATQSAPSTPEQSTVPADKAKCSCCDKTRPADAKDAPAYCAHHDMHKKDSKEMASCCAAKNAMSSSKGAMCCMRKGKHQAVASCCKEDCSKDGCNKDSCAKDKTASACCDGKDQKGCYSGKKTEKAAKS
jgi:hypothetical protein